MGRGWWRSAGTPVAILAAGVLASGCVPPPTSLVVTITPPPDRVQTAAPTSTGPTDGPGPEPISSPPSAPRSGPTAGTDGPALFTLDLLAVRGRAPKTGYDRVLFGPRWSDDVGHTAVVSGSRNGCDQRNDVLRRDLDELVVAPDTAGCVAASGRIVDPYSGTVVAFVRGPRSAQVQIDHVVPLADAWQKGAQSWTAERRRDFANDPLNLLAVAGSVNGSKGAGDAATWLPPRKTFRCSYVARIVAVKAKYRIWVTAAEQSAIRGVLSGCPGQSLPSDGATAVPSPAR